MIKVLQIGLGPNMGGIESCIVNYYKQIDRNMIGFDFADIYGEGLSCKREILNGGGHIYSLPACKKKPISFFFALRKLIKEKGYDIVHINTLSAANIIPILSSKSVKGIKVIVHSHNTNVPSGMVRRMLNGINMHIIRKLHVEKWACGIQAGIWMWGKGFDRNNVIPNAIDINRVNHDYGKREELYNDYGIKPTDRIVGYVGRLCEQKNVLFLPEIMQELKKVSSCYQMIIIGNGDLYDRLVKRVNELGLANHIHFLGLRKDAFKFYTAMDAFVLPSWFEGLPVVGIEAQAAGLPCFISDRVSREIKMTGNVSFVSLEEGARTWAKKIDKTLQFSSKRDALNDNKHFCDIFDVKKAAKRIEKRYGSLCNPQ